MRLLNEGWELKAAPDWETAYRDFDAIMERMPAQRLALRERVAATDGPVLDGSVESLRPLAEWFWLEAVADRDDGQDWRPAWLPPVNPNWVPNEFEPRAVPDAFLRLWESVAVYLGDVLLPLVPHARWVCWHSKYRRLDANGEPVIDIGLREHPARVVIQANFGIGRAYMHHGSGSADDKPPDFDRLPRIIDLWLEQRRAHEAAGKPFTWQREPTGPRSKGTISTPTW